MLILRLRVDIRLCLWYYKEKIHLFTVEKEMAMKLKEVLPKVVSKVLGKNAVAGTVGSGAVFTPSLGGAVATVLTVGTVAVGTSVLTGDIVQIENSVVHEAGVEFSISAEDYFKAEEDVLKKINIDTSNVNANVVGDYEVVANYHGKEYVIKVSVVDTTAPKVTFSSRCMFVNDIKTASFDSVVKNVREASEYEIKFIRFEKKENIGEISSEKAKEFEYSIPLPCEKEELLSLGTEVIPTEEGVYRGVVEFMDSHGNASYEEVCVVLDTTKPSINDVEDTVVYVETEEELAVAPNLNLSLYKGIDNVDGFLSSSDLAIVLELRDKTKYDWTTRVAYVDRAGNDCVKEFLITVKLKEKTDLLAGEESSKDNNKNNGAENNTNNNDENNNATTSKNDGVANNNTNNTNTNTNTNTNANANNNTNNNGNNSGATNENNSNSNSDTTNKVPDNIKDIVSYHPADVNKDGVVSVEEEMMYITPEKQACINAGYGVVCEFNGDIKYAVLMKNSSHTIDGKQGWEILDEYLTQKGLTGNGGGCWINPDNEWYWYFVEEVHEIEEPELIW